MKKNPLNDDNLHTVLEDESIPELAGPKLCKQCKTGDVCNILSTVLACYRLGIKLQVDYCPYYIKDPESI